MTVVNAVVAGDDDDVIKPLKTQLSVDAKWLQPRLLQQYTTSIVFMIAIVSL